jgi:hypothetical protein
VERNDIFRITTHGSLFHGLVFACLFGHCADANSSHADTHRAAGNKIDMAQAVVVTPANLSGPERRAVELLVDEVEKRVQVRWQVVTAWPTDAQAVIAIGPASSLARIGGPHAQRWARQPAPQAAEGYRIQVSAPDDAPPAVVVVGSDARGVLFGAGRLLRALHMEPGQAWLPRDLDLRSSPAYPIRGHQLGYRPKTNSYDAWTVPMWEQYIRDLVVFGTNAVELIPPRSDDEDDSPHFPLPKIDMMVAMSRLADEYGMDVWIWYPAMDDDYSDPATVEFALKEWGEVFERLPRIDAVFVPGGDPGHTRPRYLFALLEKQTAVLKRFHPRAQMWMSPQSFTREWMDEFYEIMNNEQPVWLNGIVFGPQNRVSLPALRDAVPPRYPIRHYPDITHSMRCQFAVPDWDLAFAVTEQREVINPRPMGMASIFTLWPKATVGFVTYSEGCNDDVNKFVWSSLGWDPGADVADVLRQYSRYFIGERYSDDFAQGLLALERHWQGRLLDHDAVTATLGQFQSLEREAAPRDMLNWRFQQALYRAYYDAFLQRRLVYETELERQAMDILRDAGSQGAAEALERADATLERAVSQPVAAAWRARVFELADALHESIRMQLSVPRHRAIHVDRGANLDLIDTPLNNREWLRREFHKIRMLDDEQARLERIDAIVNWTNPGPGGFYDDLGNLAAQPRLVRGLGADVDPEFRETSRVGFHYVPDHRMSWCRFAESTYDAPLKMQYDQLDPEVQYRVRVVYGGDNFRTRVQLLADGGTEIHAWIEKPRPLRPVEFDVPRAVTADGRLTLSWYQEPGRGGAGRGCQVAEVWLVKGNSRAAE